MSAFTTLSSPSGFHKIPIIRQCRQVASFSSTTSKSRKIKPKSLFPENENTWKTTLIHKISTKCGQPYVNPGLYEGPESPEKAEKFSLT